MLVIEPSPAAFVRIRASGRLSSAQYRKFDCAFADELKTRTLPAALLLDLRGFRGWTPSGFLADLRWDLQNRSTFSKIAVIGNARWHYWMTVAGAPLFSASMNYFASTEIGPAEEWLAGRP